MSNRDCLICSKHKDQSFEIYRNQHLVASHFVPHPEKDDNYLGYYMIESRRHFKGFYDATEAEAEALGLAQRTLSQALKTALNCEHVYMFVLGDGIPHLHIHVIAKYKGTPREFFGPMIDEWPGAPRGGVEEVVKINKKVEQEMKKISL